MSDYPNLSSIWNISSNSSQFSQLPDDDFLALLEKQFPRPISHEFESPEDTQDRSVNAQAIPKAPLSRMTPPSEESSPSPSSNPTVGISRLYSEADPANQDEALALKRKASDDDLDGAHSSKNKHTADESPNAKRAHSTRRKSSGNHQDESRLLKRKEQNRAAQRAFRERKEKHVKDLEDKLTALETKNEEAMAENANLRDLLSRLQQENISLRQVPFTFTPPKNVHDSSMPSSSSTMRHPLTSSFGVLDNPSGSGPPSQGGDNTWSGLTAFDPTMLAILDESSSAGMPLQQSQQNDFSTSQYGPYALPSPNQYRTLANNPWLMSFPDPPETSSITPTTASSVNGMKRGNSFDTFGYEGFGTSASPAGPSWISSADNGTPGVGNTPHPFGQNQFMRANGLDDLLGGNFLGTMTSSRQNSGGSIDFGYTPSSADPVSRANHGNTLGANGFNAGRGANEQPSASLSPSSSEGSSSSSQSPNINTSPSPANVVSTPGDGGVVNGDNCESSRPSTKRFTREDIAKHIAACGDSPFTNPSTSSVPSTSHPSGGVVAGEPDCSVSGMAGGPMELRKASDFTQGHIFARQGSRIPKTKENPNNVELLNAWRAITSSPCFQDADVNELCNEFSKKARCDGTKVVLEPDGVQHIIETLKLKKQQAQEAQVQLQQAHSQHNLHQLHSQLQHQL